MLSVRGVRVAYGGDVALDRLDLDVGDREVVALLGPSGCGKTTLLRVIAGLTPADAGRVDLDGRDLAGVATHQRGIGLMFQDYALFPHRDVAANVAFGLRMRGDPAARREARVAEVLDLVGLTGFDHRGVSTLSGGERQRVALARALAPAPRLLMLDEPLGALDRSLRDRLLLELSELFAQLAIGVVYVTHDQTEALALADRVVVMDRGRVAQEGAPVDLWRRPADRFVARFLGLTNVYDVDLQPGRAPVGGLLVPLVSAASGRATILIRPEAVRVVGGDEPGAAPVVVEAVAFRGDHTQVWLRLADGTRIEGRATTAEPIDVGATVGLVVDAEGVHVMDDDPGVEPSDADPSDVEPSDVDPVDAGPSNRADPADRPSGA
jgi:thiamine transport system ATP-binding protein